MDDRERSRQRLMCNPEFDVDPEFDEAGVRIPSEYDHLGKSNLPS